jgi:hypothetical protein
VTTQRSKEQIFVTEGIYCLGSSFFPRAGELFGTVNYLDLFSAFPVFIYPPARAPDPNLLFFAFRLRIICFALWMRDREATKYYCPQEKPKNMAITKTGIRSPNCVLLQVETKNMIDSKVVHMFPLSLHYKYLAYRIF